MAGFIQGLFYNYGYIVLFTALFLELLGLPTPGETLMAYCGFLVFQGRLDWIFSILTASAGIIAGITASYLIGRKLGKPFFEKVGPHIHMGPDKLAKTTVWFEKYGNGLLAVAYFIPGIRHITGYFSGVTKIPFKRFALNAYIGAFLWSATFVSLGKVLGADWEKLHGHVKGYLITGGILTIMIIIIVYLYRRYKNNIFKFTVRTLEGSLKMFHSLGRIRIAVLGAGAVFVTLSVFVAGLVQDFFANEFGRFDSIVSLLAQRLINVGSAQALRPVAYLTYYPVLAFMAVIMTVWTIKKGTDRFLEIRFVFITTIGGELLEELLRYVFHRSGPNTAAISVHGYSFPAEQTLMALVVYGFASFLILRHTARRWKGVAAVATAFAVSAAAGLGSLFLKTNYPSDILAGYVFGGVWLSINIILLEVLRIIPGLKHSRTS